MIGDKNMMMSFFECKTAQIIYEKDKPNFMKEYGKEYIRAFHEEMEYTVYKSLLDESIDFDAEIDRIEKKYRFNEDMNLILDMTSHYLTEAIKKEYWDLKGKSQKSIEAEQRVREYSKINIEQMNHGVHIYLDPNNDSLKINFDKDEVIKVLQEMMEAEIDCTDEDQKII